MRKPTAKQIAKATQQRIDRACNRACIGIQINLYKGIPAIAAKAAEIVASGADDERLARELREFAESIRVDTPERAA
jgi:hypothetical protein